jgi:anti-anti-sigma factor
MRAVPTEIDTITDDTPDFRLEEEGFEPAGLVLRAFGELDVVTAPALRARLNEAIDAGVSRVVIDLGGVTFMDSVALASVVHAKKRLGLRGRMALAVAPRSYVLLVLQGSGLTSVLDCVDTAGEAVARVSR